MTEKTKFLELIWQPFLEWRGAGRRGSSIPPERGFGEHGGL